MENIIITRAAKHNGVEKPLYIVSGNLADFLALAPEAQADFIDEALINFTCRTGKWSEGKKPSKILAAFEGRIANPVTFAEVAAILALKGEREGGKPSKDDLALGEQVFAKFFANAQKADAESPDGDLWETVKAYVQGAHTKASASYTDVSGLSWEWKELEKADGESLEAHLKHQAIHNLAQIRRAERAAIERRAKSKPSRLL